MSGKYELLLWESFNSTKKTKKEKKNYFNIKKTTTLSRLKINILKLICN